VTYNVIVLKTMRLVTVTRAGQLSLPADVRRRWSARRVALEDHDDYVVLRPLPDDAVSAFVGSFEGRGPTSDELRSGERRSEQARERTHDRSRGTRP
jgi:bifunctional DNA-binding transcriptional regulator/antitoxin component of YhaV-PrlF toxin-antitoxin module